MNDDPTNKCAFLLLVSAEGGVHKGAIRTPLSLADCELQQAPHENGTVCGSDYCLTVVDQKYVHSDLLKNVLHDESLMI